MKKTLLLSLLLITLAGNQATGQANPHAKYKNVVYAGAAIDNYFNHNAMHYSVSLEYSRLLGNNLHVGLWVSQKQYLGRMATCWYPSHSEMNVSSATAMAYYNVQLCRWLSLRLGAGAGMSYHRMTLDRDYGEVYDENWMGLNLCARIRWIIHISDRIDIALSPLIIGPSYISLVPFAPDIYSGGVPSIDMLQFSLGVKF